MWKCQFCGNSNGIPYKDQNLEGMLCLAPDCGRFNYIEQDEDIYDSDL